MSQVVKVTTANPTQAGKVAGRVSDEAAKWLHWPEVRKSIGAGLGC